jgi:Spy/CpxP family protein refolding chaperone
MKRVLTGIAVTLVAAIWMTGSWLFFNSIAAGAQGSNTAAVAEAGKSGPDDAAEGPCWKHRGEPRGGGFLKKLNLTAVQEEQVRSIRAQERAKMKPLSQQLKAGHEEFRALRKSGPFDEAKVRSIVKSHTDTLVELIVARERMKSRIYALLTPEQRAKAEKLHESWKARRQKEHMAD